MMATEPGMELRALFRSSLGCKADLVSLDPSCLTKRRRGWRAGVVFFCGLSEAAGGAERTAGAAARAERVRAARN